ncbi:MAG: PfkB family carbohydrate kinase, partial [Anaerolineae bacterium]|nr:PfkB family carbohydrate kinase [Anaerolineae bacterium]
VLSEEDIGGDETLAARWAAQTRILALTRGARGCSVYANGQVWHLPAVPVQEVDPTGAGDVFAAVFFACLWKGDDPLRAARRANCVAAISVTRPGLSGTPTPAEVARCMENHQDTKTQS